MLLFFVIMYVVKASGKKEEFNPGKILSTLRRAGATQKLANEIENEVEKKAYDGITTREILDNALELLKSRKPEVADIYDLKRAIMTLGPTGFPFEKFFAEVLRNYGYETQIDQIVSGKFSTHEIDISAVKKNIRYMVEAKYHNTQGVYTDLKVVLYVYARFLDLKRKFDVPWIVTNTRISSNAMNYSKGVGIKITSWKYPGKESLEGLIEGKKLYELARKGIEIERKPNKINIYEIKLLEYSYPQLKIEVICSAGTYIRTLAQDIGAALDVGAYCDELERTKIGEYSVEKAVWPKDVTASSVPL